MSETLQRLIADIELRLGVIEDAHQVTDNSTWSQRLAAYRQIMDDLVIQERAKYAFAGGTYVLTLAGIRSSCSSGNHGLLCAWLRKAKAEVDGRRAA